MLLITTETYSQIFYDFANFAEIGNNLLLNFSLGEQVMVFVEINY